VDSDVQRMDVIVSSTYTLGGRQTQASFYNSFRTHFLRCSVCNHRTNVTSLWRQRHVTREGVVNWSTTWHLFNHLKVSLRSLVDSCGILNLLYIPVKYCFNCL